MDMVELGLATALSWVLLTYLKGAYEPDILQLSARLFGISPTSQRNLYRSERKNGFIRLSTVQAMDRAVLFTIQWVVIPMVSTIPWYWYFVRAQA